MNNRYYSGELPQLGDVVIYQSGSRKEFVVINIVQDQLYCNPNDHNGKRTKEFSLVRRLEKVEKHEMYASGETPQVGDKVICIRGDDHALVEGKQYIVNGRNIWGSVDEVFLQSDGSKESWRFTRSSWRLDRFKLVSRLEKQTLASDQLTDITSQIKPVKLHLGSFHKKIYGFINVDIRPEVHPDLVDDCAKLEKIENNSVDLIYTSHMLEHFSREDGRKALQRWYEVLKSNGTLRISVPDFEKIASHYVFYKDLKWLSHMLNGSQRHPFDFHLAMYDETLLTELLVEVGFKNVKRYDHNKTEHFYVDDFASAYYPERHIPDDRTSPKPILMSLNLEATK